VSSELRKQAEDSLKAVGHASDDAKRRRLTKEVEGARKILEGFER